jgi:hypothetical protein
MAEPERDGEGPEPPAPREQVSREDIAQYAAYLGIDAQHEPHLLAIAEEALTAQLPDGWEEVDDGEHVFFHCAESKHSQYEHPLEEQFKRIIGTYRESAKRHHLHCWLATVSAAAEEPMLVAPRVGTNAAQAYEVEPVAGGAHVVRLHAALVAVEALPAAAPSAVPTSAEAADGPRPLARTAQRARLIRERRRAPGRRCLPPPPPLVLTDDVLCAGGLRCELALLQTTSIRWGISRRNRVDEIRQRGRARAAAERKAHALAAVAAAGASDEGTRDRTSACDAPAAAEPAVAYDDPSWPEWARSELCHLQQLDGQFLATGGGFCAMRPCDAVLAATQSIVQQLQNAALDSALANAGEEDVRA